MLNITEPASHRIALHHLGFRPFFLLAGAAGMVLMAAWVLANSHYLRPGRQ